MKNILFLFFFNISVFAQVEKMEPPFWYAGLHNPDLQIMFYGKNIAQNSVETALDERATSGKERR